MLYAVVPTHELGKARTREEMATAEQFIGILTVKLQVHGPSQRPKMTARLIDHKDWHNRGVLFPLFDVSLTTLTEKGLLLTGYQIVSGREGEVIVARELVQGWWAKFVMPSASGKT